MIRNSRRLSIPAALLALFVAAPATADTRDAATETYGPEALTEDLAALYEGLREAHADLFAHRSEAEYDAFYERLQSELQHDMTRFEAQVEFQRFAAYGNVAHARIEFPGDAFEAYRDAGGRTFPIYPRIADGRTYVGTDLSGDLRIRPGDEIVAMNGQPMSTWLERVSQHISADTPYIAHSLLEFLLPRYLWLELGDAAYFDLTLGRDGERIAVRIAGSTREAQQAQAAEASDGFEIDGNARSFRMIDERIAYLKPGPFYNVEDPAAPWDNTAFLAFVDGAFEQMLEAGATDLVIDLRQNPGGDNSFSDPMLSWIAREPFRFYAEFLVRSSDAAAAANAARLEAGANEGSVSALFAREYATVPRGESFSFDLPYAEPRNGERFEGRVFVLVNRHTYSNAVNVAAIVQDYGLGVIAGEKTSDMATTYGSMETFTLPNTGISVGFPKAHIIRPSGDRRTDGVTPDWPIASPIVNGASDAVLEALVARLRSD